MPVNCDETFKKHDKHRKCGLITGATLIDEEVWIQGFIYQYDFPEVAKIIHDLADTDNPMGFSFDAIEVHIRDMRAELWHIEKITFTGASLIFAKDAAYTRSHIQLLEDN